MMNEFEKEVDEVLMQRLFPNFPKEENKKWWKFQEEKIVVLSLDGINNSTWLSKEEEEAKEVAKRKSRAAVCKS